MGVKKFKDYYPSETKNKTKSNTKQGLKDSASSVNDKKIIEGLQNKIQKDLENDIELQKKAAAIISKLINS